VDLDLLVGSLVSALLGFYLLYALLRPERL
jgi:K+-transporting ATPase KdpF subunit